MNLQGTHLDAMIEPHLFMKTPSLFNESDDKDNSFDDNGMPSPTLSTTDSSDGLPINEDSWSLLKEFEAFTKSNNATAVDGSLINNSDDLILEELPDEFILPEFAKIDDLLMLTNNETTMEEPTPVNDNPTADVLLCNGDLSLDDKLHEASTSDILADLISHTLLMDPSLEGLLSSTTLDLSTVFGTCTKMDAGLETSNSNLASDDLCSPSQEVPEIQSGDGGKKTKKRSISLMLDSEDDEIISCESKCKKKKSGEEKYFEMRQKNNEASRRSRQMRKQKHQSLEQQAVQLEEENKKLREKAEQLEKTVKSLKSGLIRHILLLKSK